MREGGSPDGVLEPVVENDLVTITPVLLRSTQMAAMPQEPAAHRGDTDAEPPAKRPKVAENGTPQPLPGQPVRYGSEISCLLSHPEPQTLNPKPYTLIRFSHRQQIHTLLMDLRAC